MHIFKFKGTYYKIQNITLRGSCILWTWHWPLFPTSPRITEYSGPERENNLKIKMHNMVGRNSDPETPRKKHFEGCVYIRPRNYKEYWGKQLARIKLSESYVIHVTLKQSKGKKQEITKNFSL